MLQEEIKNTIKSTGKKDEDFIVTICDSNILLIFFDEIKYIEILYIVNTLRLKIVTIQSDNYESLGKFKTAFILKCQSI